MSKVGSPAKKWKQRVRKRGVSFLRAPPGRAGAAGGLVIVFGAEFLRRAVVVLGVHLVVQEPLVEAVPAHLHPRHVLVDGRLRVCHGPPARHTLRERKGEEEDETNHRVKQSD